MSKRPCMLTLHPDVGILDSTNKAATVASLVRFMFARPGRSSAIYEDLLMSFRDAEAESASMSDVCYHVKTQLENTIKRYYPNDNIQVEATYDESEVKENYSKLMLKVIEIDKSGRSMNLLTDVMIEKTGDSLKPFTINFSGV